MEKFGFLTIRMLPQKIFQPIVSGSFLSLAKVGKCNALWSTAAAAVSVVGLVSYFLKFNGITGVSQFMQKQMSRTEILTLTLMVWRYNKGGGIPVIVEC